MYVCIIQMEDKAAVAALRAARRMPPPAWEFVRAILGESQADPGVYIHSFCEADVWRRWTPRDDEEPSDSEGDDPDDFTEDDGQGPEVPLLDEDAGMEDAA